MPPSPDPQLQEQLDSIVQSSGPASSKIQELLSLLLKSREEKEKALTGDEDCPDGDEDCRELLSPCCASTIELVFGSLPVQAKCVECGGVHLLRDLVTSSQQK
jgi:hypothetical protein